METNYVEMTGRLHKWSEREGRNGTVYGRGWIEVPRSGADGTTKFPIVSFDAGDWEELIGAVVTLSGHLVWTREYDDNGDDRYIVNIHVNAMTFVRSARNGNGAKSGKSSKSSKPVGARNGAKTTARKPETTDDEEDLPF